MKRGILAAAITGAVLGALVLVAAFASGFLKGVQRPRWEAANIPGQCVGTEATRGPWKSITVEIYPAATVQNFLAHEQDRLKWADNFMERQARFSQDTRLLTGAIGSGTAEPDGSFAVAFLPTEDFTLVVRAEDANFDDYFWVLPAAEVRGKDRITLKPEQAMRE